MLSPERRAVLLLLALAVVGQGVRYLITRPSEPPGQVQLLSVLPAGSPGAHKDSAMRQARPLRPGERVDADAASASELSRLPRVGLALAKTIVANRDTHGPFGSLAGLDRVPGVGPGLLRSVGGHLSFSGSAALSATSRGSGAGVGTAFAPLPPENLAVPAAAAPNAVLNVNRATAVELEALPGIGPALARRIVADREARGPFATVQALDRVPGIGSALVARLGKWVSAP
ncbi:MAG: Helix-hairpin-helix DNA-binding class 1 [Geminicoccaceae bacterium]|jgi:competence protein ComEA|nr:Helix-hairpin-helix DNA-binding class 1 [Geminicoccaceae bacterium]